MKEESICLEHQIAMITYFVFLSFTPLPSLDPSRHIFIFILLRICPFTEFKQSFFLPCSDDVLLCG